MHDRREFPVPVPVPCVDACVVLAEWWHFNWVSVVVCHGSALEPSFLLRAVYPVLSSFETLDRRAYPRHSLSRAALMVNGSPIYVLDAFTTLIVYYSPTADPALPFPPPQNCKTFWKSHPVDVEVIALCGLFVCFCVAAVGWLGAAGEQSMW